MSYHIPTSFDRPSTLSNSVLGADFDAMPEKEFEGLKERLWAFMFECVYKNELLFAKQSREIGERTNEWTHAPILVELKRKAKARAPPPCQCNTTGTGKWHWLRHHQHCHGALSAEARVTTEFSK